MPTIQVVPHELVEALEAERLPLSVLGDIEHMAEVMSVDDLAGCQLARMDFPFTFDAELEISLASSVLNDLSHTTVHENLHNRVEERVQTLQLQQVADASTIVPQYTLYPVDESLWVAAQQRLRVTDGDPGRQLLSCNQGFFDTLIAQALHTHSFESVCKTNLFTHYIQSLPAYGQ